MGSAAGKQPEWHRSSQLLKEFQSLHERVALADEKRATASESRRLLDDYLPRMQTGLESLGVVILSSMEILDELWRDDESGLNDAGEGNGIDPVKFDIICLLEGGEDLAAEPTDKSKSFFNLKVKASGGCGSRQPTANERELFRRTALGGFGVLSADETRSIFIEHLQLCLKKFKLMTDYYELERDRSSIRMDIFRTGKIYMVLYFTPHYDLNGALYIPQPYKQNESSLSWIRTYRAEDQVLFESVRPGCQRQVLQLLRTICKGHPELSVLGSKLIREILLVEIDRNKKVENWTDVKVAERVMDVLFRLEVTLTQGKMAPRDKRRKVDYLEGVLPSTMERTAQFLNRIRLSETDLYKEILRPAKSTQTYKYFESQTLITQPNELYRV